ncbi:hypothetical protein [Verrucosispora sp. NA02020]|uniref:hypothetical protein n=1 Tax=Verrucosispora sp. NA02020 TaxID=2742132 RepID=UPI0015903996|nr:hypothetical protein [Verrucosispora sp. NA02020]QKW15339.1 hypothetical protein HUT12_22970 [Verrucosispora sp. NA02020]
MTTASMARPTIGAGPTPKDQNMDYRAYERIIDAVRAGCVSRNHDYEYVKTTQRRTVNVREQVHAAEKRGYLKLGYDGSVTVTPAGAAWRDRDRLRARGAGSTATAPAFSDSPAVA